MDLGLWFHRNGAAGQLKSAARAGKALGRRYGRFGISASWDGGRETGTPIEVHRGAVKVAARRPATGSIAAQVQRGWLTAGKGVSEVPLTVTVVCPTRPWPTAHCPHRLSCVRPQAGRQGPTAWHVTGRANKLPSCVVAIKQYEVAGSPRPASGGSLCMVDAVRHVPCLGIEGRWPGR